MSLLKYPYTNLHELNLDWLIEQLNKTGAVVSVNGKAGIVTLTGEDIARTANNPQTVEQALTSQGSSIQTVRTEIGVTPLPTTAQTITGAIAEHETDISGINTEIGTTPLPTIAQTITGAIAENAGEIADIQDDIGSTALPTTAQTLTGAIAENAGEIADIQDDIGSTALPTTAQTLTGAIAEHETDIQGLANAIGGITPGSSFTTLIDDSYSYPTTNAFILSFTLTKPSVVLAIQNYNASSPKELIISTSSTSITQGYRVAQGSNIANIAMINAVLPAGTYYLWGSAGTEGSNQTIIKACNI